MDRLRCLSSITLYPDSTVLDVHALLTAGQFDGRPTGVRLGLEGECLTLR
jgi:hypothetical protein